MRTALHVKAIRARPSAEPASRSPFQAPRTFTVTPICAPALGVLYSKYAPAIYAHCRRLLQSSAAAKDATQEAFVRVLSKGVVLPSQESEALRYLFRVSINVCLNMLRQTASHSRATPALARSQAEHEGSAEPSLASREFIHAVLARCKDGDAQVAIMHYLDGTPQVEVAELLGITRRTVFNRLHKVSRIANELLTQQGPVVSTQPSQWRQFTDDAFATGFSQRPSGWHGRSLAPGV
jgi:RNA polymerase sigma-70 factor, ECF subfamily